MLSWCDAACQSTTVPRGRCRRRRARNARCTVLLAAAVDRFGRPALAPVAVNFTKFSQNSPLTSAAPGILIQLN